MTVADVSKPRHFTDLDGMRGVLAFVVMLYHFGLNTIINKVIPVGHAQWGLCVDFFFVLSGFVLCRSVLGRNTSPLVFVWKRFGRLFPMHLVILILFAPALYESTVGGGTLLAEAFATSPLFGGTLTNAPAWSMTFEFYLPVLIVFLMSARIALPGWFIQVAGVALVLLMAIGCLLIFSGAIQANHADVKWMRALVGLPLGFVCWMAFSKLDSSSIPRVHDWWFPLCCFLFLAIVLLGNLLPALGLLLPLVIVASMFVGQYTNSPLSWAPMQWLGRLSFGIYMVHWPVMQGFIAFFGEDAIDGNVVLKAAMVLASVVLALLLHLCVEMPFMKLFRKRQPRWLQNPAES